VTLLQYDDAFGRLIGQSPTYSLLFTTAGDPFFHEACIFLPAWDQLYITSNLIFLPTSTNFPSTLVSSIELQRTSEDNVVHTATWHTLQPIPGIDLPNGGVNYKDGVLFCAQGSAQPGTGGIYYMSRTATPKAIVTNFHGRDFNSPNDAVVAQDGCIWFTDPCYGHDQGFRLRPKLPNQVYRFNPKTGDLRVVADGIGRPNGICFSPDEKVCYITDTDYIHGDGSRDHSRCVFSSARCCIILTDVALGQPRSTRSISSTALAHRFLATGEYSPLQLKVSRTVSSVMSTATSILAVEME